MTSLGDLSGAELLIERIRQCANYGHPRDCEWCREDARELRETHGLDVDGAPLTPRQKRKALE